MYQPKLSTLTPTNESLEATIKERIQRIAQELEQATMDLDFVINNPDASAIFRLLRNY